MIEDDAAIAPVLGVARALGPLMDDLTLVGGAVARLLITDQAAEPVRPTFDVDAIVEVASYAEYEQLGRRVAARGFARSHRPGDPVCRWRSDRLTLDLMPIEEHVLSFGNRWYASAVACRATSEIADLRLHHVDGPHFLATKLEAFAGRGHGDAVTSPDIEDIVRVLDGRREIESELTESDPELRAFVARGVAACLDDRFFIEALPTYFEGPGRSSAGRAGLLLARMQRVAGERP